MNNASTSAGSPTAEGCRRGWPAVYPIASLPSTAWWRFTWWTSPKARGVCPASFPRSSGQDRANFFQSIDIGVFPNRLTLVVFPEEDVFLQVSSPGET